MRKALLASLLPPPLPLFPYLLVTLAVGAAAALAEAPLPPVQGGGESMIVREPPSLNARGHLLLDYNSDVVLAEEASTERLEPASLTKIMTAYVVFRELADGNLTLDDMVTVSEDAWRTQGSRMFIEVGKQVSVEDLLKGMIVQSGNDASVALAERVSGTESAFARLMNRHAQRLGMTQSNFVNATGLPDPEHYSTPRDIAKVSAAIIREFPDYYAWYAIPEFTFNEIQQSNRNRLLKLDPSVDGIKTGHTEAAGYCLVSSAERDGRRLISVVMGTGSDAKRVADSQALLNYGFRFFETHRPYPGGLPVERLRVWGGDKNELPVGPARDLYITIPRGRYDDLSARLEPVPDIVAPVAWGDIVGEIVCTLGDIEIIRVPAVALADIDRGGALKRGLDSVMKLF